jgi:hypothetical protein
MFNTRTRFCDGAYNEASPCCIVDPVNQGPLSKGNGGEICEKNHGTYYDDGLIQGVNTPTFLVIHRAGNADNTGNPVGLRVEVAATAD